MRRGWGWILASTTNALIREAETGLELSSRSFECLNVLTMYASASELPAALLDGLFEHHIPLARSEASL